jgi:hypothetical protein
MTIHLHNKELDLFTEDNTPIEKLGRPIPVYLTRIRGILKDAQDCIFDNGNINGIHVEIDSSDAVNYSAFTFMMDYYKNTSGIVKTFINPATILLKKADWVYLVSECTKFVSDDITRYFMNGILFDFFRGGEDFIHVAATDGRKLILLKHAGHHSEHVSKTDQFIILPSYLFVPSSDYNSVQIRLTNRYGQLLIFTEDYLFEGLFECIEGNFPDYPRVIPEITNKTQWFTLCEASFRGAIDSVKSMMARKSDAVYLNAENPKSLTITIDEGQTTLEVEGTASRPMHVSFLWKHLSPCLFKGMALTKFNLDGSKCGILTHESKAGKGLTLDVTKLFMPTFDEDEHKNDDEFCIPKGKFEQNSEQAIDSDTAII